MRNDPRYTVSLSLFFKATFVYYRRRRLFCCTHCQAVNVVCDECHLPVLIDPRPRHAPVAFEVAIEHSEISRSHCVVVVIIVVVVVVSVVMVNVSSAVIWMMTTLVDDRSSIYIHTPKQISVCFCLFSILYIVSLFVLFHAHGNPPPIFFSSKKFVFLKHYLHSHYFEICR